MDANRCVCCGEIIVEDRMVCHLCEARDIRIGKILQSQKATQEEVEKTYEFYTKERKENDKD